MSLYILSSYLYVGKYIFYWYITLIAFDISYKIFSEGIFFQCLHIRSWGTFSNNGEIFSILVCRRDTWNWFYALAIVYITTHKGCLHLSGFIRLQYSMNRLQCCIKWKKHSNIYPKYWLLFMYYIYIIYRFYLYFKSCIQLHWIFSQRTSLRNFPINQCC